MMLVTFLPRALPLLGLSRVTLPAWLETGLRYVGVAVIAALLAPELAAGWGRPPFGVGPQLAAAVPATVVALWTRSLALTVLVGVATFALLLRLG